MKKTSFTIQMFFIGFVLLSTAHAQNGQISVGTESGTAGSIDVQKQKEAYRHGLESSSDDEIGSATPSGERIITSATVEMYEHFATGPWTIPDNGLKWLYFNNNNFAPANSQVTNIEYRLRIDDTGDPSTFYCGDYEIWLSSSTSPGTQDDINVYDNLGGRTDDGRDDDAEDDSDIYLNWRSTNFFNGEDPNQYWGVKIYDRFSSDVGQLDYFGIRIYYELQSPDLTIDAGNSTLTRVYGSDGTVNVSVDTRIWNIGTGAAGASELGYYLSTNTTITSGDYLIGTDYVTSLSANSWTTESFNQDVKTVTPEIPPGIYYVGLIADHLNQVAESDEGNNKVYWSSPTVTIMAAYFSADQTGGCRPFTVNFTDLSAPSGEITSRSWNFGDGSTSNAQHPSHTYNAEGDYTVSLKVSGSGGFPTDTETKTNYIQVGEPPVSVFTTSTTSGCRPLVIQFTDQSTGAIASWSWDFGDGATSTGQNPSHTYANSGIYTVSLSVTGPCGSDTETKTGYIVVNESPLPAFSADATSWCAPFTVQFTDQSSGGIISRAWDFGDGNTSTDQNPSHTYSDIGHYTVSLTVAGTCGSVSETKTDYIYVSETPTSAFSYNLDPDKWLLVNFTDESIGGITSWLWDFGDGVTSTGRNPSHTYSTTGQYTVLLTVEGLCGLSAITDTVSTNITLAIADQNEIPTAFELRPAYPNPFNPETTLGFALPKATRISLVIYDIWGREISRLIDESMGPGHYQIQWDGKFSNGGTVPSGVYIARLTTREYVNSIKLVLMK